MVENLDNSSSAILVDGEQVKAIELSKIYRDAKELGYLDEEIDALLAILKARGTVDQKEVMFTKQYLRQKKLNK